MDSELLELAPELVELLVLGVGTVSLSVAGTALERFALTTFQTGDATIGAWAAVVGAAVLFLAYNVVTDKFLPKLSDVRRRVTGPAE
jgi:hypothetical protein